MFPIQDSVVTRHPPVATWLIIAANALVFAGELTLPQDLLAQVTDLFGLVPARFVFPSWAAQTGFPVHTYWPFVTSMFLHAGWLHIIGNMWFLWIFGASVEDRMGPLRYLGFYLVCGVAAGFVHVLTNPTSAVPTIGASGAIAGVMGAYLLMFPGARIVVLLPILFFPFFFDVPAFFFLGFWFFIQLYSGSFAIGGPAMAGGIAFWAHVGGFMTGALLCWLFRRPRGERRPYERDEWGMSGAWARGR